MSKWHNEPGSVVVRNYVCSLIGLFQAEKFPYISPPSSCHMGQNLCSRKPGRSDLNAILVEIVLQTNNGFRL